MVQNANDQNFVIRAAKVDAMRLVPETAYCETQMFL
ncbi:hypothetical protein BSY18_350 [Blastomonas sp. RAC04]|nr:hypothetical protein BSY18_350 [Blastomonas sp. RAC04]